MGIVSITELTTNQTNVNAANINQLVVPLLNEFNGSVDNSNIKANANIDCTKTNANFGSKTITTTGALSAGAATVSSVTASSVTASGNVVISGTTAIGDTLTLSAGSLLTESTAPTTAANQGAVYTKNDGTQTELYFREESDGDEVQITKGGKLYISVGVYETTDASQVGGSTTTLANNTQYQAAKPGQVTAYNNGNGTVSALVGTASANTTILAQNESAAAFGSVSFWVAKDEYWKVTGAAAGTVRFKPLKIGE